jgi:hypothetical protein
LRLGGLAPKVAHMETHATWIARRTSRVQLAALRAVAEGRVHAFGVATMAALLRREFIEEVDGAPRVTELGLAVLAERPEA